MPELGVPELLIIAVIVLLLFGPAKAADIGGSLGKSIREFRKASKEDDGVAIQPQTRPAVTMPSSVGAHATTVSLPAPASDAGRVCVACGAAGGDGQRFCTNCGAVVGAATG